jgi:hypothetical protein
MAVHDISEIYRGLGFNNQFYRNLCLRTASSRVQGVEYFCIDREVCGLYR